MPAAHRRPAPTALLATIVFVASLLASCTAAVSDGHGSAVSAPASVSPSAAAPSTSSSSASATPAAPTPRPADFRDCTSSLEQALTLPAARRGRLHFGCATIDVPLDYRQPTGSTIQLVLLKVHDARNTTPAGSLLVNPGGPGGSGIDLVASLSTNISDTVLAHFDLIGFDPRGVGLSSPIRCLSDAQKDTLNASSPDVRTRAGFALAKQNAATLVRACDSKVGVGKLAQFDTVQTARDMDQIRQAVGDKQMNFLGFSYGTELGAQYAHLFPQHVGVMVLDGAVDPKTSGIEQFAEQLQGFEGSFDQFARYCVTASPCRSLGNPRTAVYGIVAAARRNPIPGTTHGKRRTASTSLVYTGVLSALYSRAEWPTLGRALVDARNGNSAGLLDLADNYLERTAAGTYTNITEANTAISCNDQTPGPSDQTILTTARNWATRFPMFGLWSAASLFQCQSWQPQRTVLDMPSATTAAHPLLVVGNLHDPATPYQGAQNLTEVLGRARLLTWNGEGHTSYLEHSSCIDRYVNRYLVSGTLPPTGTTCQ